MIELKHSWNAIKTDTIKETTQNSWTEAIDQLKKIHKEDVDNLSLTARSIAKIAGSLTARLTALEFIQQIGSEAYMQRRLRSMVVVPYRNRGSQLGFFQTSPFTPHNSSDWDSFGETKAAPPENQLTINRQQEATGKHRILFMTYKKLLTFRL